MLTPKQPCLHILNNQRGVTLMIVLVMVVVTGLAAGMAGSTWKTVMQQTREKELLWRGDQYRKAIESYSKVAHAGGVGKYPRSLEELIKDPRSLQTMRHIRRLYVDPMTGEDFVLIKDNGGRIKGVRSASEEEPFKKDNFSEEYDDFVGKTMYSEWKFVSEPPKEDKK